MTHADHSENVQDYGRSRYSDIIAEHADGIILEGFGEDAVYNADGTVAADLVNTGAECAGLVILRRDSQGFVDTETAEHDGAEPAADVHGHYGAERVRCMWRAIVAEYTAEDAAGWPPDPIAGRSCAEDRAPGASATCPYCGADIMRERCRCPRADVPAMAEVCADCGAESRVPCPWQADTCSACSAARDRYARPSATVCPAHGAYLPPED